MDFLTHFMAFFAGLLACLVWDVIEEAREDRRHRARKVQEFEKRFGEQGD